MINLKSISSYVFTVSHILLYLLTLFIIHGVNAKACYVIICLLLLKHISKFIYNYILQKEDYYAMIELERLFKEEQENQEKEGK